MLYNIHHKTEIGPTLELWYYFKKNTDFTVEPLSAVPGNRKRKMNITIKSPERLSLQNPTTIDEVKEGFVCLTHTCQLKSCHRDEHEITKD